MPLPYQATTAVDVKGTILPTQQANRRRFEKGKGWTTIEVWEGPTEDGIYGKAVDLVAAGYTEIDFYQTQPGVWRVEASIPGQGDGDPPDDPIDEWVLDGTPDVRPITESPYYVSLGGTNIRKIEKAVEEDRSMPDLGSSALNDLGTRLYTLLQKKVNTYYTEQIILRHTQTVATFAEVQFSMDGRLEIFTTAQLPTGITPAVQVAINSISYGPAVSLMTQGWLKMPTNVRQNIFSRAEIIEEWHFGYHPTDPYSI